MFIYYIFIDIYYNFRGRVILVSDNINNRRTPEEQEKFSSSSEHPGEGTEGKDMEKDMDENITRALQSMDPGDADDFGGSGKKTGRRVPGSYKKILRFAGYALALLLVVVAVVLLLGEVMETEVKVEEVDVNDELERVRVDLGADREAVLAELPEEIVVRDEEGEEHTAVMEWDLEDYNPGTLGDYPVRGSFDVDGASVEENTIEKEVTVDVAGLEEIDVYGDVEDLTVDVGDGTDVVLENLADEIIVEDGYGNEHDVEIKWRVEDYDGDSAGSYYAIGSFYFDGKSIPGYQVYSTVTVTAIGIDEVDVENNLRDISVDYGTGSSAAIAELADNMVVRDEEGENHTVSLDWNIENYSGWSSGEYRAVGSFELKGEAHEDYVINSRVTVEEPELANIDIYGEAGDVRVSYETPEREALGSLTGGIAVQDEGGGIHRVPLDWNIEGYRGGEPGSYNATGTFSFRGERDPDYSVDATVIVEEEKYGEVDVYGEVYDISVEHGTSQSEAINQLPDSLVISDEEGGEHRVELDWDLQDYQASPEDDATFNAVGKFDDRGINLREDRVEAMVTVEEKEEIDPADFINPVVTYYEWEKGTDFHSNSVEFLTDRELEAVYLWSEVGNNWLEVLEPGPNVPPGVTSDCVRVEGNRLIFSANAHQVLEDVVGALSASKEQEVPIVHYLQFEGMGGPRHASDRTLMERTVPFEAYIIPPEDDTPEPAEYISPPVSYYQWEMDTDFSSNSIELQTDKELEAVYLWSEVGNNWLEVLEPGPNVPPGVTSDCVRVEGNRLIYTGNAHQVLEDVVNALTHSKVNEEPIVHYLQFEGMEGPHHSSDRTLIERTVRFDTYVVPPE